MHPIFLFACFILKRKVFNSAIPEKTTFYNGNEFTVVLGKNRVVLARLYFNRLLREKRFLFTVNILTTAPTESPSISIYAQSIKTITADRLP